LSLPLSVHAQPEDAPPLAAEPAEAPQQLAAAGPALEQATSVSALTLGVGEIRSVPVKQLTRIAVGNPDIVDVSIVSGNEILLQAKATGATNLLVWDETGHQTWNVQVHDPTSASTEESLRQLIGELNLPGVGVKREEGKLFLTGEVPRQEDLDRLEQMLSAYPGVTNLTTVSTVAVSAADATPLVKLAVQVIEVSRSDTQKLGVNWGSGFSLTQPAATDLTGNEGLYRWGTGLARSSFAVTLNALIQQNKARILAEPKLVTASGKEASSFIGLEVPVIQATTVGSSTGSVTASIEFRKTGVVLKMTPHVLADQQITTSLEAEVSGIDTASGLSVPVGTQTIVVPGFKVRKANTEVTTTSGETIFIAGLLEAEDSQALSQVPALGSVPFFGRIFRSPENKTTQRELIIAVTPELVGVSPEDSMSTDKTVAVEQALAVAEVTASVDDPTLRYALQVQQQIAKAVRYPVRESELGMSGHVKLRLHLFRDGTLGRAVVSESSGIEAFDIEALKAAETQAPYPPFPSELQTQDLWLELPVLFRS